MWRRLFLLALAAAIDVEMTGSAAAAEPATIALTVAVRPQAAEQDRQLAEDLLALIELRVQTDPSLSVVERRRIDLAIQELVLDRSRRSDAQLQLGKLVTP